MIPLFEQYPELKEKLPYISLGEFPTPVKRLGRLGDNIGIKDLYIKQDDLSGKVYGGNKVRKLEFIMGHALQAGSKGVLTFGYAGSNHALATTIYAKRLGLKSLSMLLPQPNARYVRRNLLMGHYCGAEIRHHRNIPLLAAGSIYQLLRYKLRDGRFPLIIPPGGSSPLGVIGFVNAAFELKRQIMGGEIMEPDCVYVALGSTGTAVGLMIGFKVLGLKCRVIPVRVVDERFANAGKIFKLFRKTDSYLHSRDPSFPEIEVSEKDMGIRHGFFGEQYGLFTEEGREAMNCMEREEGIKLDGTYTGKTLAALINDAKEGYLRDKVVLFWNTYNSRDFSKAVSTLDYRRLIRSLHCYFEEEVQPLDMDSIF